MNNEGIIDIGLILACIIYNRHINKYLNGIL